MNILFIINVKRLMLIKQSHWGGGTSIMLTNEFRIVCHIWSMQSNLFSKHISWSKPTLNYWMMMERYPNLKDEVGSLT